VIIEYPFGVWNFVPVGELPKRLKEGYRVVEVSNLRLAADGRLVRAFIKFKVYQNGIVIMCDNRLNRNAPLSPLPDYDEVILPLSKLGLGNSC
jgi:hypothetical protein